MSLSDGLVDPSSDSDALARLGGLFPATSVSRYLNVVFSVVLLLGSAAGGYWGWVRSGQASLEVDGVSVSNSQQIINQADVELTAMAAADGAVLDGSEACFFAQTKGRGPGVVCGPVWLGVSPREEPWIEMEVEYQKVDDGAVGVVGTGKGTVETRPRRELTRPDGKRPATPGDPVYSMDGIRSSTGFRFEDPGLVLTSAEQFVAEAGTDGALAVESSPTCFFTEKTSENGYRTVGNDLWCGPALTASSSVGNIWAKVSITDEVGEHFGSGTATAARIDADRTWPPPEDAVLLRPDGVEAPTDTSLSPPPLPTGAVIVAAGQTSVPVSGSGSLATSSYRLDFTGFARGADLGDGPGSYVAPSGHDVVVADIAASEKTSKVDAVITVDGQNQRVEDWRTSDEASHLVVVVPSSAESVDLVITDNGVQQTMSLLDGVKQPGFPAALYREDQTVNAPFVSRVSMPAGDDVVVSGTVEAVQWSAVDDSNGWLPDGQALLSLEMMDVETERPCCDVRVEEVAISYVLSGRSVSAESSENEDPESSVGDSDPSESDDPELSDPEESDPEPLGPPDRYEPQNPDDSLRSKPLQFLVDESLASAELEISVTVTISVDGVQQQVSAEVTTIDLGLQ